MNILAGTPAHISKTNLQGTPAYAVGNFNQHLVQVDQESGQYQPVDSLTRSIPSAELDANFGLWQDREVTKVQADEVKSFPDFRREQGFHYDSLRIGGDQFFSMVSQDVKVTPSDSGTIAVLESGWQVSYGDTLRVGGGRTPLAPR